MGSSPSAKLYYNISAIKELPILDVAAKMGISVEQKGKNYWCKIRDESNPSVVLHPDNNRFFDFGSQDKGDVIRFVQYARNISTGEAIRNLADMYDMKPTLTYQQLLDRPLTCWEYRKIGLHGDLATKNFAFPVDSASLDQLCELEQCYKMPLSQLMEEHPNLYRDLVERKAGAYMENLRNAYCIDIWTHFSLVYAVGDNSVNAYRSQELRERFQKDTTDLNKAEQIYYRAQRNAGLKPAEPPVHDAVETLQRILSGSQTLTLGNQNLEDIFYLAEEERCPVLEADITVAAYFSDHLQNVPHCGQYKAGKITVQYLFRDDSQVEKAIRQNPGTQPELAKSSNKHQVYRSQAGGMSYEPQRT